MLRERISDATFVEGTPQYLNTVTRHAARGVVFNEEGQIAMLYMKKNQAFKLPGGGIEENETKEAAFLREVKEEIGCDLCWYEYIGSVEEHKNKTNFFQYSNCFMAHIGNHQVEPQYTETEKALDLITCWMDPSEALMQMKYYLIKSHDYQLKFMVLRDLFIIKYVLDNRLNSVHEQ